MVAKIANIIDPLKGDATHLIVGKVYLILNLVLIALFAPNMMKLVCDIESMPEEMIEHDITIRMSHKRKYFIKAKITKIRKAEPQVVIPENTYNEK